jgi:hypothetical protein
MQPQAGGSIDVYLGNIMNKKNGTGKDSPKHGTIYQNMEIKAVWPQNKDSDLQLRNIKAVLFIWFRMLFRMWHRLNSNCDLLMVPQGLWHGNNCILHRPSCINSAGPGEYGRCAVIKLRIVSTTSPERSK